MAKAEETTTKKKTAESAAKKKVTKKEVDDGIIQETSDVTSQASEQKEVTKDSKDKAQAPVAKAGKHSAKALKEAEAKEAKEARKAEAKTDASDKQSSTNTAKPAPKTRSILERKGKKFREAVKLIEADKTYSLVEGLGLAIKTSTATFDASVELHVRLNVDPRQADQNIRQTVTLPAGSGKTVRVAVFAEADQHAAAKKAGADVVGAEEFLQQLDKGTINFDILIATPSLMAKLGKYARVLGPKGLMPNPKSGTVAKNVSKAVEQAKAGRVEYRVDSTGIIHLSIGKVSFGDKKLQENAQAVLASIKAAKPSSIKGIYLKSAFLATSMGPSIKLNPAEVL